jgi:hypothetical protein
MDTQLIAPEEQLLAAGWNGDHTHQPDSACARKGKLSSIR